MVLWGLDHGSLGILAMSDKASKCIMKLLDSDLFSWQFNSSCWILHVYPWTVAMLWPRSCCEGSASLTCISEQCFDWLYWPRNLYETSFRDNTAVMLESEWCLDHLDFERGRFWCSSSEDRSAGRYMLCASIRLLWEKWSTSELKVSHELWDVCTWSIECFSFTWVQIMDYQPSSRKKSLSSNRISGSSLQESFLRN